MKRKWPSIRIAPGITVILMLIFSTGLRCQAVAQQNDTIVPADVKHEKILRRIRPGGITGQNFNYWEENFTGHWAGVNLGLNGLTDADYTGYSSSFMENDFLRSNSLSVNFFQQNIGLQHNLNTIGLVTGLGMHFQSYRLDKNTTLRKTANGVVEPDILMFDQNQKSKLSIVSLMIPLLAEFQIPVRHYENRLYFSGGVFGRIRLSSHTKIKYRAEGKKEKLKVPGDYAIYPVKYGLMVRSGYRWVHFFATYDLVPLFRENKGPHLTPFTVGLTLISF